MVEAKDSASSIEIVNKEEELQEGRAELEMELGWIRMCNQTPATRLVGSMYNPNKNAVDVREADRYAREALVAKDDLEVQKGEVKVNGAFLKVEAMKIGLNT